MIKIESEEWTLVFGTETWTKLHHIHSKRENIFGTKTRTWLVEKKQESNNGGIAAPLH